MLADVLTHRLRQRFPDMNMSFGAPPEPAVVIPAVHPDVGDIKIFDDGDEATVIAGNFTHSHFSDFDARSQAEAEQQTADNVVSFLERLFADQIVLWGSHNASGGWYDRNETDTETPAQQKLTAGKKLYVWSGPLRS